MNDVSSYAWVFIPIVAIGGSFVVAIFGMMSRARVRELEIRERIAMIERGLVPPPEADPAGFERRMHAVDRMQRGHAAPRFRAGGIFIMSVGFGLMMLITSVGSPEVGIGVGGFLVIIGLGFLMNSFFSSSRDLLPPAPPGRPDAPNGPAAN